MTDELMAPLSISESLADEPMRQLLTKVRMRTRASLARKLKVSSATIRDWEKRIDHYISTLRSYVEGVGGKLKLLVELPDRPPILLTGLGEAQAEKRAKKKASKVLKSKAKTRRAA